MDQVQKQLLAIRDVAPLLGVGPSRVYQLVADGELPAIRVGRAIRIPRGALEDWLRRCERRAMAALREGVEATSDM